MNETESTFQFLKDLASQRYWGAITLKFENGNVVHVRLEENLKPNELPGNRRFNNAAANTR